MTSKKSAGRILILLAILIVPSLFYLFIKSGTNNYRKLEIYGPREPSPVNEKDTIFHTVKNFQLTSHLDQPVSLDSFQNKIFVADFFFATCQTICPKMSMQMKRVQEAYLQDPEIALISFTVNPAQDTVEALAAYAKEYGVNGSKWSLVTGDKKQIYDLARQSFFVTASEGSGGADDFIHSEMLVLVDKDKHIRGFYNGTDYEDVNKLIEEIKVLKYEYRNDLNN
jgi:protein SCO1/2